MGSGFKDFAAGDILTAADVDGYLMRQTVMTFADASARDAALSGVLDEGMVAYLEDTNATTYYTGSAWIDIRGLGGGAIAEAPGTFAAGDVLQAAELNRLPGGIVDATAGGTSGKGWAKRTSTVAFASAGVATDFTGLTVTFNADSSRIYRTTGTVADVAFPNSGDQFRLIVADGSNNILNSNYLDGARSLQDATMTVIHIESGISGSQTRKLRGEPSTAINAFASTDYYHLIVVEDIGPA